MKIKFLGTIAAEGGPAMFCNCEYCQNAQLSGGKDIRTRSQILINDNMLIDFPADSYYHKLKYGLDFSKIRYLLVTHSHSDHFNAGELGLRKGICAYNKVEPVLNVYSNCKVRRMFYREVHFGRFAKEYKWHIARPFHHYPTPDYDIWTLKARHAKYETALLYLIKEGDKAFLECFDTGYLFEKNYEYLEKIGVKLDVVCLDSTKGLHPYRSYWGHMGLEEIFEVVDRMRKSNFVKPTTRFIITHVCHNGLVKNHEEFEKLCAPHNIEVAYDGMDVEI